MKKSGSSLVGFYTMGVAGLFLVVFFLTVIFGARTYLSIVAGQTENNETRAILSYLATCMRTNDTEGAVEVYEEDGITVLAIADGGSGYGLRIYQYQGVLLEEYGRMGDELYPEDAQVIGETAVFQVEEVAERTYAVTTDGGRVLFHARCGETTEAAADE